MKKFKLNVFLYNILVIFIPWFLIEIIFKIVSNNNLIDISTFRIFLGTIFLTVIISFIELFIKPKNIKVVNLIVMLIITIYSFVQVGFHNFIGVYISLNLSSQAGAVISYIFSFLKSFYWYYYLLFIPIIMLFAYYKLIEKKAIKIKIIDTFDKFITVLQLICLLLVVGFTYYLTINLDIFQNKLQAISNKELFNNPSNPNIAIKQFGIVTYGILDIKNIFVPSDTQIITRNYSYNQDTDRKSVV